MSKFTKGFYASLLIVFTTLATQAQARRTFVSGVGDDVSQCSRTAPCKTFVGALAKTLPGGEIDVLDAGSFGTVTIGKSVTIDATGTFAGILALDRTGITIDIIKDPAKSPVRLRGLSINGMGSGRNGINVISAGSVSVEDCVIDGFKLNGILVNDGEVFVRNTTIRNNATAGINTKPLGGKAAIADVALVFNGVGIAGPVKQLGNIYLFGNNSGDPP